MLSKEGDPLGQVVAEYKQGPHTPQLVAEFWQKFIMYSIEQAGIASEIAREIIVPVPNCTTKELEALRIIGRGMVYNTGFSYPILWKIFPGMGTYMEQGLGDNSLHAGWSDVDISIDPPNRNTTEADLERLCRQGRRGLRLSTYIWASQAIHMLTGKYLDQDRNLSRLLGTRMETRSKYKVIIACFYPNGHLGVSTYLDSGYRDQHLGGRFERWQS